MFFYMEDKERTLDSPTDKILMAVNAYAGELEREMARFRSRDASRQRAAHGFVSGGRSFGYDNFCSACDRTIPPGTTRCCKESRTGRCINEEEALVVRRIFEMSRDGKGGSRIARVLNGEGAPVPRAQRRRPAGWVASSVGAVLRRPIYRGSLVWGKAQKRDSWGQMKFSKRPEAEWLTADAPKLRIVSDALWEAAHERLRTSRLNYLRTTDGKLWGKPANGVESKYLLTGMSVCGACGGGMQIYSRSHGRKRAFFYGCPRSHVVRCTNGLEVRMETADAGVLRIFSDDVLDPAVISRALDKLMAKFAAPAVSPKVDRARIATAQKKLAKELANLQEVVASGEASVTVLSGIGEREKRQRDLQAELAVLDGAPAILAGADGLRREALRLLDEWRGLLGQQVGTTRQLLRKLLDRQRVVFYPKGTADRGWYNLGITPSLDKFFDGLPVLKKAVASPTGFVSLWTLLRF